MKPALMGNQPLHEEVLKHGYVLPVHPPLRCRDEGQRRRDFSVPKGHDGEAFCSHWELGTASSRSQEAGISPLLWTWK